MKADSQPTYVFKEAIAPFNVLETKNRDLLGALTGIFPSGSQSALKSQLQEWFQRKDVFLCPSGEAGIAQIVSLLPQKVVVMPAWICHQVKTAVRAAGKEIKFVDLEDRGINARAA